MLTILGELGLTKTQIATYEELLSVSPQRASELAKRLSLSRAGTYDTLRALINDGIVSESYEGQVKVFQAANPMVLKHLLEKKKSAIKNAEVELEAYISEHAQAQSGQNSDTKVTVFTGKQGMKVALEYVFEVCSKGDEVLAYGLGGTTFFEYLGPYYHQYISRHVDKHKIRFRAIVDKTEKESTYLKQLGDIPLVKAKFGLKNFEFPIHTRVFGNCVAQFIFGDSPKVILVEDVSVANAQRYFFESLWKQL